MVLTEWDTPEKQIDLLNILRQDGIGIPNNLVLETAIRYAIERRSVIDFRRRLAKSYKKWLSKSTRYCDKCVFADNYGVFPSLPTSRLRFFTSESDEDATPLYVFVFEENSKGLWVIFASIVCKIDLRSDTPLEEFCREMGTKAHCECTRIIEIVSSFCVFSHLSGLPEHSERSKIIHSQAWLTKCSIRHLDSHSS